MSSELPVVAFRRIRRALMPIHLYAAAMTLSLCTLPLVAQTAYFSGITETLPGSYANPPPISRSTAKGISMLPMLGRIP